MKWYQTFDGPVIKFTAEGTSKPGIYFPEINFKKEEGISDGYNAKIQVTVTE